MKKYKPWKTWDVTVRELVDRIETTESRSYGAQYAFPLHETRAYQSLSGEEQRAYKEHLSKRNAFLKRQNGKYRTKHHGYELYVSDTLNTVHVRDISVAVLKICANKYSPNIPMGIITFHKNVTWARTGYDIRSECVRKSEDPDFTVKFYDIENVMDFDGSECVINGQRVSFGNENIPIDKDYSINGFYGFCRGGKGKRFFINFTDAVRGEYWKYAHTNQLVRYTTNFDTESNGFGYYPLWENVLVYPEYRHHDLYYINSDISAAEVKKITKGYEKDPLAIDMRKRLSAISKSAEEKKGMLAKAEKEVDRLQELINKRIPEVITGAAKHLGALFEDTEGAAFFIKHETEKGFSEYGSVFFQFQDEEKKNVMKMAAFSMETFGETFLCKNGNFHLALASETFPFVSFEAGNIAMQTALAEGVKRVARREGILLDVIVEMD